MKWFELTTVNPLEGSMAAISAFSEPARHLTPGTYGDGLLTVLSEEDGARLLMPWAMALGSVTCLLTTGLGDAFYLNHNNHSVYFLNAQYGVFTFIDRDTDWFLFDFLRKEEVIERVLNRTLFRSVLKINSLLKYGETFYPAPFLSLGGAGRPEDYVRGDTDVYLALLAQSIGVEKVVEQQ